MCGFCGVVEDNLSMERMEKMIMSLKHRGPDSQEVNLYEDNHCSFAHARLSIIDLSKEANQPMDYHHFSIVFNGEIYNFSELKDELIRLGHTFALNSDTEVILHAYEQWGTKCVEKFIGMFAFAILDKNENEIILFRDRAGVKPLYYYFKDGLFMFASELKAFFHHPRFDKKISPKAVALYFKYHHIPAPFAIFENTNKLEPGHYLKYSISDNRIELFQYWNVLDYYCRPVNNMPYNDALLHLESILQSAFKYRMVADVPVGVFLSGGYDSCGVAAMLQAEMSSKLKTFTIGFTAGKNEAPDAKKIANYIGTDHTEYICSPEDAINIIPDIPRYFDEPFDDSSAIPTFLVSRLARQKVTVALSADGGDETFGGYSNIRKIHQLKSFIESSKYIHSDLAEKIAMFLCKGFNQFSDIREKGETFSRLFNTESFLKYSISVEGSGNMMESLFRKLLKTDYPPFMF